jgi:hypothetical protein
VKSSTFSNLWSLGTCPRAAVTFLLNASRDKLHYAKNPKLHIFWPNRGICCLQKEKLVCRRSFGVRFIEVSSSAPSVWIQEFIALLPVVPERAPVATNR